jgi:hypothetical protein
MKKYTISALAILVVGAAIAYFLFGNSLSNRTEFIIKNGLTAYDYHKLIPCAIWLSFVLFCYMFGSLSYSLACKKGYRYYFWFGFFLWIPGLIYVAGLPNKK